MSETTKQAGVVERILHLFVIASLMAGSVLRLIIYLQNRNLIIDEANVARNIYERSFIGLSQPLSYEQYAPPVFLWITKLFASVLGYSEYVLRLYPFLASIASLVLFALILRKVMGTVAQAYLVFLFSISPILIRYASELKQYAPDVFITLSLLYLALQVAIDAKRITRFVALWFVVGSLAIWASMPSVFILAGIGCYYGMQCLQQKRYKELMVVIVTSVLWAIQFLIYYIVILKPQISSSYLQSYHLHDFLFATPSNGGEWMHNWAVFNRLIRQFGDNEWFVNLNAVLLLVGIIGIIWKAIDKAALFLSPILCLLIAAALNQYSMLPRVALFSLPLVLIAIGMGLHYLLQSKYKVIPVVAGIVAFVCAGISISHALNTGRPYKYEELTEGLGWVSAQKIKEENVYIHHAAVPAFRYYTQIHPGKERWAGFANAKQLQWYINNDSLAWQQRYALKLQQPVVYLFTNVTKEELEQRTAGPEKYFQKLQRLDRPYIRCYVYNPNP